MTTVRTALLATAALAALAAPLAAQETRAGADDFRWSEPVAQGAWLKIRNYRGPVDVKPASGSRVEVHAVKEARNGRMPEVRFQVLREGRDVVICAIPAEGASCTAEGVRSRGGSDGWRNGQVAFTIQLPRGVRIDASSGNGAVTVQGAAAEVVASSGNGAVQVSGAGSSVRASSGNGAVAVSEARGPVEASTGNGRVRIESVEGPVNASSGNGDIDVTLRSGRQTRDMELSTGNGDIRLNVAADFQGEIEASTGHGSIVSDLPLVVQGRMNPMHLRGTIGQGGPHIRMSSGNGSLELRRAD